jgi:hypothetical protein
VVKVRPAHPHFVAAVFVWLVAVWLGGIGIFAAIGLLIK